MNIEDKINFKKLSAWMTNIFGWLVLLSILGVKEIVPILSLGFFGLALVVTGTMRIHFHNKNRE